MNVDNPLHQGSRTAFIFPGKYTGNDYRPVLQGMGCFALTFVISFVDLLHKADDKSKDLNMNSISCLF